MTNTIEIEDGNGEHIDILVCVRLTKPLILPDNEIDICSICGEAIQHRPHVPKLPRKVCMECVMPEAEKAAAKGELNLHVTEKTARELAEYYRKKALN